MKPATPSREDLLKEIEQLRKQNEILTQSLQTGSLTEIKYTKMLANISDVIVIIDHDGNNRYKSPNIETIFGWHPQEMVGRNTLDNIHPDDVPLAQQFIIDLMKVPLGTATADVRYRCKDGSYKWIEFTGTNLLDDPDIKGILGNYRDITQQKQANEALLQSEERQRLISDSSDDIIYSYDLNRRFTSANRAFTRAMNLDESSIVGKTHEELGFPPAQCLEWNRLHELVLKTGSTVTSESESPMPDGINHYFEVVMNPLHDTSGTIVGIGGTTRDISTRKLLERDLIQSKIKAEESNRLKLAFLQNMSHEVRTPLNVITGFSQLLTKPNQSAEKIQKFTSMIQASSNKLIDIISDVIEISQIQTNSINVNKSDFDIIKTIAEVVAEEKIKTIDKHLELTCAMSFPRNQFTISSDKSKVMKIVKHLVDNAIKFTEKGSVRVAAGLHRGNMTLTVTDTGIGISGDMQEKIFEPFRQNASGMCRNYGGNGLGLAIVKAYTDMLGGTISLQSQPNAGTTISVTLPIVDFDDKQLSLDDTPREKSVNSILVVEDEMTNYEFLVELLEERNTSIIHARNGQMAVEICRSGKEIDLILMDIKMPIINGYDAARLIKSFRPDIPIVAQTAYALDIDMKKIEENGFDDFICKPIKENEFFAKIDRFLKP